MKRILLVLLSLTLLLTVINCGSGKKGSDRVQYTDQELLELAEQQYNAGNARAAVQTCERLLLTYPTSNLHIETQLLMSKAYGAQDLYEEQMNLLLRLLRENIIPEYSPQVYVQIGKFYERAARFNPGIITSDTTDYRLALDYYEKAINYPDSDDEVAKSEAQFRRGLVEAKIGQIDEAIQAYRKVVNNYPNTDFSLLAQVKLQNPGNISELAIDKGSLNEYRDMLESPVTTEAEGAQEKTEMPAEQDDGSMDNLIEKTLETPEEEPPVTEETPEAEPTPENIDPFATPVPADSSANETPADTTGF